MTQVRLWQIHLLLLQCGQFNLVSRSSSFPQMSSRHFFCTWYLSTPELLVYMWNSPKTQGTLNQDDLSLYIFRPIETKTGYEPQILLYNLCNNKKYRWWWCCEVRGVTVYKRIILNPALYIFFFWHLFTPPKKWLLPTDLTEITILWKRQYTTVF